MVRRATWLLAAWLAAASSAFAGQEQYFNSGGVRIHYTVEGHGEPVLLIHGFIANVPLQWGVPGIIRKLSRNYQVIAYDNRGHGLSDKPHDPSRYGMEMVEDPVRLLDHLGIRKAHVVGYSMGAMIASKLAMTHPDRVLSLTLGGAAGIREGSDLHFFDRLADDLDQGRGIGALINALTPIGHNGPTEAQLRVINVLFQSFNDPKALAACVRSWKQLAIPERQWRQNRIPTLAIVGELDPLLDNVDDIKSIMPSMQEVILRHSDHMTTFSQPAFVQTVLNFLARHPAPRPATPSLGQGGFLP